MSLSAPPVEEIKVGTQILQSLNLRPRKLEIVSCPSCGRAQVDVYKLADEVTAGLDGPGGAAAGRGDGLRGERPGEAREADLGVASGNGKGQIFVEGEVIKTVPERAIVETLIEEAMKIAETMETPGEEHRPSRSAERGGTPARASTLWSIRRSRRAASRRSCRRPRSTQRAAHASAASISSSAETGAGWSRVRCRVSRLPRYPVDRGIDIPAQPGARTRSERRARARV